MCVLKAWQFLERNHEEQWVNVMLLEFNGFMQALAQKVSAKNAGTWVTLLFKMFVIGHHAWLDQNFDPSLLTNKLSAIYSAP